MIALFIITLICTLLNIVFLYASYCVVDHNLRIHKEIINVCNDKINLIHQLIQRYLSNEKIKLDPEES